jgi:4-aminobutyrate aminotransferase
LIAEPMRAVPVVPPPGYWTKVAESCRQHDTLLIMDEIPTGLGKTGKFFAYDHDDVTPDIITLGKALGAAFCPLPPLLRALIWMWQAISPLGITPMKRTRSRRGRR